MNLQELVKKYNKSGPRYTSYPPVPFWQGSPTTSEWLSHVTSHYDEESGIDLYVHVPYCESLCYYCGCSRVITKNHNTESVFINAIKKEWEIYKNKTGKDFKIGSIHFGGGTPTFLSPKNLKDLIQFLTPNRSDRFVGSIEIDPRTCQKDHLKILKDVGISRVSFGIQDFDENVQKEIHRVQSVKMVQDIVNEVREIGFTSLNFDLIYGLPLQTAESIKNTIQTVIKLNPDLIAFYSYAHLPDKIKNQKLINSKHLPDPIQKKNLFDTGVELLNSYGFMNVGMDHFAKEGSFLHMAKINKRLKRNFMGYVDKKSPVLIGLGPSAISDSSVSFIQNEKDVKSYFEKVNAGCLAHKDGHTLTTEEIFIQEVIENIMCNGETHLTNIYRLTIWPDIRNQLQTFIDDKLLNIINDKLEMTEIGMSFVRNVAMCFDLHLHESKSHKFSQTI